ncbi:S-layer family protein [Microcoleus sp. FACHB-53]|nr:S-layer family protein [Microcoleus sp. FACHB-53]
MKSTPLSVCTGLLLSLTLSNPVVAQVQNPEDITPKSTASAVDLRITPRLGVGYSTSGGGYDGFTRFEGFVPLLQNPGTNLTFLEGRLLLDNSADLGGNLLLGHRLYNSELNRTFGGYVSYDNRSTGKSSFNQLGLGLESLGKVWDFRVNGYIPLGNSRKLVSETGFDTGLQASGTPFFQGNYLITQAIRESQQVRRYEAALGGFDIEAGAKIAKLGDSGDLRGYGGVYYYGGKGTDSALGWRVRLEARPTDNLNIGVAVQDDRIFGTNVLFNVGVTFPGTRPKRFKNESESVVARLGESISRTNSIAVDSQTEATSFSQNVTVAATNPQTGAPYVFQHVNSGQAGGNGTIENPFAAIEAALGATQSDGNSIVYVSSASNSPALSSFQIRDGVQVLSSGPIQEILTKEFGLVRLPGSGSGNVSNVAGTVTLGNNTVLSGFAIASTNTPGIEARNISNAIIRDNTVTSTAQGVRLENVTGTVTLTNNNITSTGEAALEATNINNASISQSSFSSTNSATNGITLNGVSGNLDVTNSTLTVINPTISGLSAQNITGTVNIAANSGSQINTSGSAVGISLRESTGSVNLSGLQANSTGGAVLEATNINNANISQSTLSSTDSATNGITLNGVNGTVDVSNTSVNVTNPTGNGISAENVTGTVNIAANSGSQINTNGTAASLSLRESTGSVNLSGLQATATGGAVLEATNINNANISQSTLSSTNSASNGITLNGVSGTVGVSDTTVNITTPAQNGILASNITGTVNLNAKAGSTITTNGTEAGIALEQSTGSVNLSGLQVNSTGGAALEATNLNEANISQSILSSTNSATNGITLNGVSGRVDVSNSTVNVTNPTGNGISAENVTGTVNIAANSGSQINTNGTAASISLRESTGSVNLSGLQATATGGAVLEATNLNEANISQSILSSTNSATNGITLNGVSGKVDVSNSSVNVTNPTGNGISAENVTGTVNIAANSGSQINTNGTAASLSLRESTGSVNLSGLQATATGGAVLEAANINNANIAQSTLSSTNSATNGITLNGVSGTVGVSDTTVNVTTPAQNGILASNITGTVNLNANAGSTITTNGTEAGIALEQSTGSVNLSGLQVNSTGGAALTATNVNNGSLTQSTLTSTNSATSGLSFSGVSGIFDVNNSTITVAQPTNDGISVVDSTGIVSIAANPGSLITNAVNGVRINNVSGGLTASGLEIVDSSQNGISATNSRNLTLQGNTISNSGVDGINLNEVTGNITIANNSITNSVNNAIQFTNTTGQTELSVSNNQVTNAGTINGFDGISIATAGDAVSTLTFSDNQFTNVGDRYAFYLDTNGNSSSNFIFSNNQVTSSPGVIGGVVLENNAPASRLCLQMNGNTSSGASFVQYALSNNGNSQYQVVDLANVAVNNTGSLQFFGGPFTSVPVCPAP